MLGPKGRHSVHASASRTLHSGGSRVDPTVEIPYGWIEHIYHVGSTLKCIIRTISNAIVLNDEVPADCVVKVVIRRSRKIIFEKSPALPEATPMVVAKRAWQKQRQSTGKLVGGPVTMAPRVRVSPEGLQQEGEESRGTMYCKACASNHVSSRQ